MFVDLNQQVEKSIKDLTKRVDDENCALAKNFTELLKATVPEDLKMQLADKVSVHKVYRMKSEIGEWYSSVYNGKEFEGSGMGIVSAQTSYRDNPAVWWSFQVRP